MSHEVRVRHTTRSPELYAGLETASRETVDGFITAVRERIVDALGITSRIGFERVLLYGYGQQGGPNEMLLGWLEGMAPGVVLFEPIEHYLLPMTGLLLRSGADAPNLFSLRPVPTKHISPTMYFYTASRVMGPARRNCPICVDWNLHPSLGARVGINQQRWEQLESWLEGWLPYI